ncbi:MAG TPA: tRNA pseudouridine(55) synthase TruB [Kofleriaceae bacterium]|nr:tRNA pseudouridine(55) synthase TruB [Kofleriaceae bacterium]
MNGVLVVDKPAGPTSHKVVAEVSRRLGGVKAGHAGTLDPMATGVLVVCVGEATKIAGVLVADDKAYDGELELGVETDTLDAEGQPVRERRAEAAAVDRAALAAALARLDGPGQQVPPMYSAVKVDGRRLHAAARAGDEVERAPRPIDVRALELLSFDPPRARFRVDCSKGTYVRVLVADTGAALGCGAHLTALRRTRSGAMTLEQSVPLGELTPERAAAALVPVEAAIGHLPSARLSADLARAVSTGKPMNWNDISPELPPAGVVALLAPEGRLLALCEVDPEARIRYRRVFLTP